VARLKGLGLVGLQGNYLSYLVGVKRRAGIQPQPLTIRIGGHKPPNITPWVRTHLSVARPDEIPRT